MVYPTIHVGGTHPDRLIEGYMLALAALAEAERAVDDTAPNARDYAQNLDAFSQAGREHVARLRALRAVVDELRWLVEDVLRQRKEG